MRPTRKPSPARRPGFSLIELMTVIGILAVLMAILFVGFRGIAGSSRTRASRVTLDNLNGLLAEYEVSARSLDGLNAQYVNRPSGTLPLFAGPFSQAGSLHVVAPGDVSPDNGSPGRYASGAVVITQDVMGRLRSVPAGRSMFDALPTDGILPGPTDSSQYDTAGATNKLTARNVGTAASPQIFLDPPLLTDPWGGPIIYVPPGGLSGVTYVANPGTDNEYGTADDDQFTMTSKGALAPAVAATLQGDLDADVSGTGTPYATVRTRGLRPFFASAGADGSFIKGDDNVYSFGQ